MARAKYQGPADRLLAYEQLVATLDGVQRKGAANPYTSLNGYMTSFLDKEGSVAIRLGEQDREEFLERYDSQLAVQYGSVMKEFVVIPDQLLELTKEASDWFARSYRWVGSLPPK